jgi:hypothetical protein
MKSRTQARKAWLAGMAAAILMTTGATTSWGATANYEGEIACYKSLTKAVSKQAEAIVKNMAACNAALFAGEITGPCPDADTQAKLDKAAEKAFKSATKKCQSSCSGETGLSCIANSTCPPNGALPENCTAAGANFFDAFRRMGYPGPYCTEILGRTMRDAEDFGSCFSGVDAALSGLGELVGDELLLNIYGDLDGSPALTPGASACLAAIAKSGPKTASKLAGSVSKCRNTQLLSDPQEILPNYCPTNDQKTADALAKTLLKFTDTIGANCNDLQIAELDLCGGTALTVDDAKACLSDVLEEVAYSTDNERTYASISIINAAYPESSLPRCGDNVINQVSNQFAFNGEECDGVLDDACPGRCFPPGDVFECTCGTIARAHGFADGFAADLDNGWTGKSHNAKVTDQAGFVTDVTNCTCDAFDPLNPATCLPGESSDPICDLFAETQPRCSSRLGDSTTCDEVGNLDGGHYDADCQACDAFAVNAGGFCTGQARFCSGGTNNGDRCNHVSDCPGGACTAIGRCITGPFIGIGCTSPASCGGGSCSSQSCVGGDNHDDACATNADCSAGGGRCGTTSDCLSQCFAADGVTVTGPCAKQSDCDTEAGERCRGICDTSPTCVKLRNGAPLPLSANGTSVCVDSQFFTNITGTRNIYTGQHAINYELRSGTFLAGNNELNSRPCPVCGGFCEGDLVDSFRCEGTCTGTEKQCRFGKNIGNICTSNADCDGQLCTGVACRFDDDCPSEDLCVGGTADGDPCVDDNDCTGGGTCTPNTCTGEASPECSTHGTGNCRLDLACGGGTKPGQACRIEAYSAFGTTSSDCPLSGTNISGDGLAISWTPLTSGVVENEEAAPCDLGGYENFDCNCVRGGGSTRNQPNSCDAACTDPDPQYFGRSCNALTTCVGDACIGGTNNGNVCTTNGDCPGLNARCSSPSFDACLGGPFDGQLCTTDLECGLGSQCTTRARGDGNACDEDSDCASGDCGGNPSVCGNGSTGACSIRRCTGGTNAGQICTQPAACTGGGSCPTATPCEVGGPACSEGECLAMDCTTALDCDNGATCDNACPNGRCTPLCLERGVCDSGDRQGKFCAVDDQCVGGGTCIPDDAEEGSCANGSFNHCDGPGWEFKLCLPGDVNTQNSCAAGVNGILGDTDDNPGAGFCRADVSNCFINNGATEGGSTLNGKGDATNTYSVATFCIPASTSDAVNTTAGLPGPGRIRQPSVVVPNYTELPVAP